MSHAHSEDLHAGHHDHAHDHDEHHESFGDPLNTFFSMDHKPRSLLLITAIIMAVIAMTMSIIFRMQLAWLRKICFHQCYLRR